MLQADVLAGLAIATTGLAAVVVAQGFRKGAAHEIGPAYFPSVIGAMLAVLGAGLAVSALRRNEPLSRPKTGAVSVRPLLVLAGVILFAALIEEFGLAVAAFALVFLSALAGSSFRLLRTAALLVALVAFASLVFVVGLGLPIRVFPT
ncbi:MAG TPA: tripartite tricarboxylate transporter TctB family protein [Microvirga sp.]|jgi:hypothetical protein|nr:tripartite tricarboxylate transporter TctB family protein [Microvirga sp.]